MRVDYESFDAVDAARPAARKPPEGFEAFRDSAHDIASALWYRKGWILGTTLLCFAAAFVFVAFTTPLYKATSQLLIDPRSKQVLQGDVTPTGLGTSSSGADSLLVDSQVEIIQSFPVLKAVVAKEHLNTDSEFGAAQSGGLRKTLSDLMHALTGTPASSADATDLAIERLQKLLIVKRVGNTYVIDISVFSANREKAARIANAVAEIFLSKQSAATADSTRDTTTSLAARLENLGKQMVEADAKVEAYRKANNLLGTQGVLLDDRRMQEFNDRLVAGRAQEEASRSRYEQAKRLSVGGARAASTSPALDSLEMNTLRRRLAEIDRQLARLGEQYGPRYPGIEDLKAEQQQAVKQLGAEIGRLVKRAKSDYELARDDAGSIATNLDGLRALAVRNGAAQIKLRELQAEATAARTIYDAVLARTKQSTQQEGIPTGNFRIISPAVPPLRVSFPPAALIIVLSLIAGFLLGCLAAWLREQMSFEVPDERGLGSAGFDRLRRSRS